MDVQGSMVPRRSDGSVDDEVASNTSKDDQREAWRQIEGGPTVPSTSTLCGTLKKRHAAEKSLTMQWGKRYFFVDDKRGLLQYSKNAKQIMTKPSMMIPLADIVAVEKLEGGVVGILPNCCTKCFTSTCSFSTRALDGTRAGAEVLRAVASMRRRSSSIFSLGILDL